MTNRRSDRAERFAFNAGCEARLAGRPLSSYNGGHLKTHWYEGWRFVDEYYGMEATRLNRLAGYERWPIRPLPEVQGG
jgi:ribosome modulation factor